MDVTSTQVMAGYGMCYISGTGQAECYTREDRTRWMLYEWEQNTQDVTRVGTGQTGCYVSGDTTKRMLNKWRLDKQDTLMGDRTNWTLN